MKTQLQGTKICCLIIASLLLLSACGPGTLFGPTITPTPTSTPTHTPTLTPTSIPSLTITPIPTRDPRILNPENQHLYLYPTGQKTWSGAVDHCLSLGGYLVSIETASENDFVYQLTGGSTWLGASDKVQEGIWIWASGEPFDFSNWDEGEPNNCCPPENCGSADCTPEHYLTYSGHGKTWNDVPASAMKFVCEWEPQSP
jgi:hypothetical protein